MKRGIILVNAYWNSQSERYQAERLREEFQKIGIQADIRQNNFFPTVLSAGGEIENQLSAYDFCVFLDKDKYVSAMLEAAGMRLFNRRRAIGICDDKMLTYLALSGKGFPLLETMAGLLCYTPEVRIAPETLDAVQARLGYPVIVKESYGSLGKGVYKAENRRELEEIAERLKYKPHLFQRYAANSCGRDVRVVVVGGRVVAAVQRTAHGDFRSNAALGGSGETFSLNEEGKALCVRVAKELELDYCGIDLLFGEREGDFVLCEVNSNAFFGMTERVTGVNIAQAYALHIAHSVE